MNQSTERILAIRKLVLVKYLPNYPNFHSLQDETLKVKALPKVITPNT